MAKKKPNKTTKTSPAMIAKIRKMKAEGATAGTIAEACKVSKATVYTYTAQKKKAPSKPGPRSKVLDNINNALVASSSAEHSSSLQEILEAAARLNLQVIIVNGRAS